MIRRMLKSESDTTCPEIVSFMKRTNKKSRAGRPAGRPDDPSKRNSVTVIGAGRMGTTLARAVSDAGYSIELILSKHAARGKSAGRALGAPGGAVDRLSDPVTRDRLLRSGILIISTPDDALPSAAHQLATAWPETRVSAKTPKLIALHTSGAASSEVLADLRKAGFAIGSLHPLVSVATTKTDPVVFRDAYFCIEGDREAVGVARIIVRKIGGRSFTLNSKLKPLYHAAAVISSGHMTSLFDLAIEMLRACGLSASNAQRILLPLLETNTQNLKMKTPARALTGPFARGDRSTVEKHLAAIKASQVNDAIEAYMILGRHSLRLVKTDLTSEALDRIAKLLSKHQ
jgi:predicted short-subunit dehydrogenase-like oxidoreductase (DUF2520 family)